MGEWLLSVFQSTVDKCRLNQLVTLYLQPEKWIHLVAQSAPFKEQHPGSGVVYLARTVMELDVNMSWVISLRGHTSICFFSDGCRPAWLGAVLCFGAWLELPASAAKPHAGAAQQTMCKCFEMFCLQTLQTQHCLTLCVCTHVCVCVCVFGLWGVL